MRPAAAGAWVLLVASGWSPLAAQGRPRLEIDARRNGRFEVLVSLRDLLADDRYVGAMRSGFPLYLEYRVELRETRSMWDRTVQRERWEFVVLYDPVREVYRVEDAEGTEELPNPDRLARRLGVVYRLELPPDGPGRYHYRAAVTARTLSDEDVDEVYAWLGGASPDSIPRHRPGLLARTARKLLVQVAPLPRVSLEERTDDFVVRD